MTQPPTTRLRRQVVDPDALLSQRSLERLATDPRTTTNSRRNGDRQRHDGHHALLSRLAEGATVQIQNCERSDAGLALVCAELQRLALGTTVGCNAYLSPDAGVPGLTPHRDATHTTIVQIHGTKEWTVWATTPPPNAETLAEGPWSPSRDPRAEVVIQADLRPGDVLQIALGDPHVALCRSGPSVHLTFAHRPVRSSDVLAWVADRLAQRDAADQQWCATTVPEGFDDWLRGQLAALTTRVSLLSNEKGSAAAAAAVLHGRRLDDDGSLRPPHRDDGHVVGLRLAAAAGELDPETRIGASPQLLAGPSADRQGAEASDSAGVRSRLLDQLLNEPHSTTTISDLRARLAPAIATSADFGALHAADLVWLWPPEGSRCW
ncbi:MAG: JmjC domain-containing protein [Acidimicrobiales bacterium]